MKGGIGRNGAEKWNMKVARSLKITLLGLWSHFIKILSISLLAFSSFFFTMYGAGVLSILERFNILLMETAVFDFLV